MLRARAEDDYGLAGLHNGKTLPDGLDDRPLADRGKWNAAHAPN
jgi:hypothetical protein